MKELIVFLEQKTTRSACMFEKYHLLEDMRIPSNFQNEWSRDGLSAECRMCQAQQGPGSQERSEGK
jgi:hypothetical protein